MAGKVYTKTEAARHCGVTFTTVQNWIRAGYKRPNGLRVYLHETSTAGGSPVVTAASVERLASARAADAKHREEATFDAD